MSNTHLFLVFVLSASGLCVAVPETVYGTKGSSIIFDCPYKNTSLNNVKWQYVYNSTTVFTISEAVYISTSSPVYTRVSVVGDHPLGQYNLQLRQLQESDEVVYRCSVVLQQKEYKLELLAAPSSLTLQDVTDNKILGTEGQSLTLRCIATGGKPPPLVTITLSNAARSDVQSVDYIIPSLQRGQDKQIVRCDANSSALNSPLVVTDTLYLNLKPLQPIFSPYPVSTEETKPLVVSCTSNGSRPAATFKWMIGTDTLTSDIKTIYVYNTADDTYKVTSVLTYSVDRIYNGQTLTCVAYTSVFTSGVVAITTLDVKYAPDITVTNVTYNQDTATKTVTCKPIGNPTIYTYYRWQHRSKYGVLIRELDSTQNGVLTLPSVPIETRYQDSGEYICTVSNGILDKDGKINQTGSGYVTVIAQPRLIDGNKDAENGEFGKDVGLHVYVYSFPKYTFLKWYKSNTPISSTEKYNLSDTATLVADTFYGIAILLDGYRVTLSIRNLAESDFNVTYRVELSNGVGQTVAHTTLLISASPPQTPINFTVLISSESSVVVKWESGYNGANEQSFYVEYRTFGSNIWDVLKIFASEQTGTQTYTLTGLQDGTLYELRMYSENKFNKSLPTQTETTATIKGCKLSPSETVNGSVAGGLSAVIVIMLIIIIVLILWKHRRNRSKHIARWNDGTSYHNQIDATELDGQKDTINRNTEHCTRSTKEYETLGMKDAPNTYSELLTLQDKQTSKSVQEYETLGMADDPNTYSELLYKQVLPSVCALKIKPLIMKTRMSNKVRHSQTIEILSYNTLF